MHCKHNRVYVNTYVFGLLQKITNVKTLKDRLIYARGVRGLSQAELANKAKCSQSTIGNVESGERDTLRNLVMVARVLQCSADWLYDGVGPKPVQHPKDQKSKALTTGHGGSALFAGQEVVSYMPAPQQDPLEAKLLELFHQLDDAGKQAWLSDLGGFVRGSRPHPHGTAPAVAGKK